MVYTIVKGNREESNEQTKCLKDEVLERLARTRDAISEVEGKTSSSLSCVYENINSSEEKHTASIVELSESLVVRTSWLVFFCLVDLFLSQTMENKVEARLDEKVQLLLNKEIEYFVKHEGILFDYFIKYPALYF